MNRAYQAIIVGMILLTNSVSGQSPIAKPKSPVNSAASKNKSEAEAEADRLAKERRAQARSLLISLASDARSFRDQRLRARTLARVADALWDTDLERGRELFRKAWEAAESADQETARKLQEEIQRQKGRTGGGYAVPSQANVRGDVLRLAAGHDRKLGEEFLPTLKGDQQKNVNGEDQRLSLARDLLVAGDPDRALQFAASELSTINMMTVDFLSTLRERNAVAADERYATMLDTAARNLLSDANTVSLLSSYIFTPHAYVMYTGGGESYGGMPGDTAPASVAPELRLAFFQTAQTVLLRQEPQAPMDSQAADTNGKYLVMKRLMPFFEQYAPPEMTQAVGSRFEALGSMVRDGVRRRNPDLAQASLSAQQSADIEQAILDRIEHAKNSAERDRLYFELADALKQNGDLRAREFVSKIDDSEFRKQAQAYVDASLATYSIQSKKVQLAQEIIQKGELSHIQRVWLMTKLAKLLAKKDRDKSLNLLEDAVAEARRFEGLDPDHPRALLAIANAQRLIEPLRTFDSVFEAVKAANSAEGFTGEDGALNIVFQIKGYSSANDNQEPDFDIKGIFGLLANDDFNRAVELAQGFQGEAPRAAATIAIARSVLSEKAAAVTK